MSDNEIKIIISENKLEGLLSCSEKRKVPSLTELIGIIKDAGVVVGIKREVLSRQYSSV